MYGTDEQTTLGAWELVEANIAPLQDAPVSDPTPLAMSRSGRLLSPNVRHTAIVPSCVCCFFRYCRHDTLYMYNIYQVYVYSAVLQRSSEYQSESLGLSHWLTSPSHFEVLSR